MGLMFRVEKETEMWKHNKPNRVGVFLDFTRPTDFGVGGIIPAVRSPLLPSLKITGIVILLFAFFVLKGPRAS